MKQSTYKNKLAALLGIDSAVVEKSTANDEPTKKPKSQKAITFDYVEEDKIQELRQAQAISYFLQAPKLFTLKTCPHCGDAFFVSRNFMKFCTVTCIKKDFEERGIRWERGNDLEALVNDPQVYDGNEPLTFKNIEQLKAALEVLCQSTPTSA